MGAAQTAWANMPREVYAALLQGLAASEPPSAADLAGVGCPALILALPGDPEHPLEAAEELQGLLPNAELAVATDVHEARESWGRMIGAFLKKAWMSEFMEKRIMPQ